MRLPQEKSELIRKAFKLMRTKEDLLNLINKVANIQYNSYTAERTLEPVDKPSLQELDASPDTYLNPKYRITQKQLDFFSTSFNVKDKARKRYTRFTIKKKSGGIREIKAPFPKLKEIQRAINNILQLVYTVQEQAFGFVPSRNITDNARLHIGSGFVLNIDIQDFFPSIHFRRVKKMLEKSPFHLTAEREPLAFLIANLCTEEGVLPQGAPTSPILTNIICQRLDRRLQELANQYKAIYSRYADDITFSSNDFIFTRRFMQRLEKILKDDRFILNQEKTRIQGKAFRQEVTGLTVNEKVNVSRQFYRSYRTLLHLYKSKGPVIALEYHRRRMPESVLAVKMKKEIRNVDTYIQNVLRGKFFFICMVKGVSGIAPPFEKKEKSSIQLPPLTSFKMRPEDYPTFEEMNMVMEDVITYGRPPETEELHQANLDIHLSKNENYPDKELIKLILSEWEKDQSGTGFEKAMELLKNRQK